MELTTFSQKRLGKFAMSFDVSGRPSANSHDLLSDNLAWPSDRFSTYVQIASIGPSCNDHPVRGKFETFVFAVNSRKNSLDGRLFCASILNEALGAVI
jgi:hypothetical protein